MSDGGEEQGAEEVTVHGTNRETSRRFWKEHVSRERLCLFSAQRVHAGPMANEIVKVLKRAIDVYTMNKEATSRQGTATHDTEQAN